MGSEARVETNGRTDTTDRIALPLTQSAQLRSQQISYQVIMQWMAG